MTRADLLALTPESLAALTNRGLVKRATRDLDAGRAPQVGVDADGAVRGSFPDGVRTTLPAGGGLESSSCTCAATGVCRHRIGLVLAYQRQAPPEPETLPDPDSSADPESPAGEPEAAPLRDWSPGAFDDDTLARVLGERALTYARRTHRAGYTARVHRPDAADPVASVELPTCTVRFLVPDELGYAHTDAAAAMRGEVVVLAVWAFREADERGLTGADLDVDVGGEGGGGRPAAVSGLDQALDLADQVLLDGAMHAGPVLGAALRRAHRELTAKNLHWPAAAFGDLADQLAAYRERAAAHEPERPAALIAEIHARHRAAQGTGVPRSQVLGTDEAAQTPLRSVRLTALGCRIGGTDSERTAEVYLAHAATGVVLVLKRGWEVTGDEPPSGSDLASRTVAGAALRALATGTVLSENATRSPSRVVRLGAGRLSKTAVTPVGASWGDLPAALLVRDLRAPAAEPPPPPRLVRPRVEAESVRVVEIAEIHDIGYHAGAQRLQATFRDAQGASAVISAAYSPYSPGGLDSLAAALEAGPRYVSGSVRRSHGTLVVDPIAVLTPEGVTVPDLAPGDGAAALDPHTGPETDPLTSALTEGLTVCADAAHRGLRHVPPATRTRIGRAAGALRATGLTLTGALLDDLAVALDGDDPQRMVRAWVDAQIRLLTAMELR